MFVRENIKYVLIDDQQVQAVDAVWESGEPFTDLELEELNENLELIYAFLDEQTSELTST